MGDSPACLDLVCVWSKAGTDALHKKHLRTTYSYRTLPDSVSEENNEEVQRLISLGSGCLNYKCLSA